MESSVNAQPNQPTRPTKRHTWLIRLLLMTLFAIGTLFVVGRMRPSHLGVKNGRLAECPGSPNCVSTQAERASQRVAPLRMEKDLVEVTTAAREIVLSMPRAKFVAEEPNYCHIECTSLLCRYVDDLEIWIDEEHRLIHARSASRVGYSDLGVNRKRVETLFNTLIDAGVASSIRQP